MIMYELYQMGQQWQRLCVKPLEPLFNNPLADWYMDLWIEAGLHIWFWPGSVIMLQDQMDEFVQTFSICKN